MTPVEIASMYLGALVRRDPAGVPLAEDVRRINNGHVAAEGADHLREVIRREPPLTMGSFRWVASGDEAAVFYELEADMGTHGPVTAVVGERFVVNDGRISEIEVVFASAGDGGGSSSWGAGDQLGAARGDLDPMKSYLGALVSHEASAVPLALGVRRMENGHVTGDGADDLRASLESDVMKSVQGISGERWIRAGDSAVVFYDLHARVGEDDMMVRVAERFRAQGGQLTEIEAVFTPVT